MYKILMTEDIVMTKRPVFIVILLFIFVTFVPAQQSLPEGKLLEKAKKIHESAITLDTHVDISGKDYGTKDWDPGIDHPKMRCDLVKMKKGGMDGVFLAVFVGQKQEFDDATYKTLYRKAMDQITAIKRIFKNYPDRCEQAFSPDDVERIEKTGKRAIMIGMENGYPVGNNLKLLKEYYDLGTRYITLCHWNNNQICDAATAPEPKHNGFSQFGRQVVAEMNRLGMICDVSHIAESSFWDLLKISKAPVIASHSGCYALTPHKRNLTDKQLKALAKNGGVVQVVTVDSFLETKEHIEAVDKIRKEMNFPTYEVIWRMSKEEREKLKPQWDLFRKRVKEMEKTIPNATLKDFVNHIDHAVKVAGIDHVGIGTDFDGGGGVQGFENHAEALNVTVELLRRGYSEQDIKKIWGGNLLRVWRKVEAVSKK
jgi:membrane dipeptidase